MDREGMAKTMDVVFDECHELRGAGQKEYAHTEDNAFGNFERVAVGLGLTREAVLMVYLLKHVDGIKSFIQGHKSQREDVRGRINDCIVYLCLLRGMIDENEKLVKKSPKLNDSVPGFVPYNSGLDLSGRREGRLSGSV